MQTCIFIALSRLYFVDLQLIGRSSSIWTTTAPSLLWSFCVWLQQVEHRQPLKPSLDHCFAHFIYNMKLQVLFAYLLCRKKKTRRCEKIFTCGVSGKFEIIWSCQTCRWNMRTQSCFYVTGTVCAVTPGTPPFSICFQKSKWKLGEKMRISASFHCFWTGARGMKQYLSQWGRTQMLWLSKKPPFTLSKNHATPLPLCTAHAPRSLQLPFSRVHVRLRTNPEKRHTKRLASLLIV